MIGLATKQESEILMEKGTKWNPKESTKTSSSAPMEEWNDLACYGWAENKGKI